MLPHELRRISKTYYCVPKDLNGGVRELNSGGLVIPLDWGFGSDEFKKDIMDALKKHHIIDENLTYDDIIAL